MEVNPTEVNIFRGGSSLVVRTIDVKVQGGCVQPARGVSLQIDPAGLDKFGGAYRIESVPSELRVIQRGKNLGHFEIVPREPMPIKRFQELLDQVKLVPHEG